MAKPPEVIGQPRVAGHSDDGLALFQSIYNRFVHLVLYARVGQRTWAVEDELVAFTVFMRDPILVQINREPLAWTPPTSTRAFSAGETIEPSELLTCAVAVHATWAAGPSISAIREDGRWLLRLNLRGENFRAQRLVAVADEFLQTACWSLDKGLIRAFTENAFHAVEALAKAELLSYPITAAEVEDSRRHAGLLSSYHLWARLNNTDHRFPRLLQDLLALRATATYADAEFAADKDQAQAQLATLLDLRRHVADVHAGRTGGVVNVIATRDLSAGELVTRSDAAIRPPKTAGSTTRSGASGF